MFVKWFVLFSWVALVLKLPSKRRRWIYHPEHHLLVSTNSWACPGLVLLQMISVIIVHWCLCEPCHQHHQYNIRSLALFWFHVWWLVLSPKWFFLTLIIYYLFNWNKYFFLKPRRFRGVETVLESGPPIGWHTWHSSRWFDLSKVAASTNISPPCLKQMKFKNF